MLLALLALLALPVPALAQAFDVPPAADPARIPAQERDDEPTPPPPAQPEIRIRKAPPVHGAPTQPVLLERITLHGNTVYSDAQLQSAWAESIGKKVGGPEIAAILAAITAHYQQAGYPLSRARYGGYEPEEGILRIEVIEGYVSEVRFTGETTISRTGRLDAYAEKIRAARPLTAKVMERYLYLMDDIPGITASADLQIAMGEPGAVLEIALDYDATDIAIGLNNRGTKYIGPWRASLGTRMHNRFGRDETLGFTFSTTPGSFEELLYGEVSWRQAVGSEGTQLGVGASKFRALPSLALPFPLTGIAGTGELLSLSLRHPLIRGRKHNLSLIGGYNHQHTRAEIEWAGPNFPLYDDRIGSLVLGAVSHHKQDRADSEFSASLTHGLDWLGPSNSALIRRSRPDADESFTKLEAGIRHRRKLDDAGKWSVFGSLSGQYSFDPLLASEEFGLGGAQSVRAFDSSHFTGDSGVAATAELRFQPKLLDAASTQFYGFLDSGRIWDRRFGVQSASATGLGVRVRLKPALEGYTEAALPLHPSRGDGADATRFFMGITARF